MLLFIYDITKKVRTIGYYNCIAATANTYSNMVLIVVYVTSSLKYESKHITTVYIVYMLERS